MEAVKGFYAFSGRHPCKIYCGHALRAHLESVDGEKIAKARVVAKGYQGPDLEHTDASVCVPLVRRSYFWEPDENGNCGHSASGTFPWMPMALVVLFFSVLP